MAVDGDASLGTGAVVRADVLARLLGLRLLRLEADIVLVPAGPPARAAPGREAATDVPVEAPAPPGRRTRSSARWALDVGPPRDDEAAGAGHLGDARRLLAEADALLADRVEVR